MKRKLGLEYFLLLFLIAGCGQADRAKREAIVQMRDVANAIKQCPEQQVNSIQTVCHVYNSYTGPPTNLEWDVLPSKTVRSTFQGTLEFTLPHRLETLDPPNQSIKDHDNCVLGSAMNALKNGDESHEPEGPKWREVRFRYEFDLGDAPELVKSVFIAKDRSNNAVTSPTEDSGRECWVIAARSIGSAPTKNPSPKQ
ncbi:MAG: hypothetical protein WCA19_13660 [Candidatus Acidiferrales bacterium]